MPLKVLLRVCQKTPPPFDWCLDFDKLEMGLNELMSWGHLLFNNIIDLPYLRWKFMKFSSRNKLCCIIFM